MGRPRSTTPVYREHKQTGRARCVWTDRNGNYHDELLPGLHNSEESRRAYARLLLELEVAPHPAGRLGENPLLVNVLDLYHEHARRHYRGPDGRPTSEYREHKLVIRAMRLTYGNEPAREFGPLKLRALRQGWVTAGLSRGEVNRRTNVARRVVRWAVAEELVPAGVLTALEAVNGLQRGRTIAPETEPVRPVAAATVDATLPHLNRHVRGLVEFQRLTGCRPGEACVLRMCDVDTSGEVWLYRPERHKNAHRGKSRVIPIGPRAQKLLRDYPTEYPEAYVFSAAAAVAEFRAERTRERATPRYASHMERNAAKRVKRPKRQAGERYTSSSYAHAVARACDLAFPPPPPIRQREDETRAEWQARLTPGQKQKLAEWRDAHRWHPNQLRHAFASEVRKAHGLEAAQVLLGHEKMDVTQIYAEKNLSRAVEIAAEIG